MPPKVRPCKNGRARHEKRGTPGVSIVNCSSGLFARLFVVGLLSVMTFALGACGRKAGLDQPPSASAVPTANEGGAAVVEPQPKSAAAVQPNLFNAGNPADRMQYAPRGQAKPIILDPILD
jgi:predicted small lipoprotein YifL